MKETTVVQGFVCIHPVGRLFFDYPVTDFSTGSLLKKKKNKKKTDYLFQDFGKSLLQPSCLSSFLSRYTDFCSCLWALPGFFKILVFAKYTWIFLCNYFVCLSRFLSYLQIGLSFHSVWLLKFWLSIYFVLLLSDYIFKYLYLKSSHTLLVVKEHLIP